MPLPLHLGHMGLSMSGSMVPQFLQREQPTQPENLGSNLPVPLQLGQVFSRWMVTGTHLGPVILPLPWQLGQVSMSYLAYCEYILTSSPYCQEIGPITKEQGTNYKQGPINNATVEKPIANYLIRSNYGIVTLRLRSGKVMLRSSQ